jgi:hypothetical protein
MRAIRKIVAEIGEGKNIEYYITLFFIVLIFALDIFNLVSSDILTNIVLAVLALIVYSSLSTRRSVDGLAEKITGSPRAETFFWKSKRSVETDLSRARDIRIVGAILSRTIRDYRPILEERLSKGAQVKIMVMDPDSTAPDQAMLRSKGVSSRQFYVDNLRPTIERIGFLSETSQHIELGLLPYKPAYGMILIDVDDKDGLIIVEMYPHHSDAFAPTFELHSSLDAQWYNYFSEQFNTMWSRAQKYKGSEIRELTSSTRSA